MSLESVLLAEIALHPRLNEQDVYKLLSQAVFGGDHLLENRNRFLSELSREWDSLDGTTGTVTPPVQVIDPLGHTARIHLAPMKASGIGFGELAGFLADQELKRGLPASFADLWESLPGTVRNLDTHLDPEVLASMTPGESPVHHSRDYGFAAYRICNDLRIRRSTLWFEEMNLEVPQANSWSAGDSSK
jgi:hypothetical protein